MNEIGRADWPDNIPYGPLTQENFNMLGVSYYDAGAMRQQEAAASRDVGRGDYLRFKFAEQVRLGAAEPQADADSTPPASRTQLRREPGESQEDWETRVKFGR